MKKGFTLMELIVVIAIVATLAVVAYPNYIRAKMEARRADAQTAVISTEGIVERYLAENNLANFTTTELSLTQFENYDVTSGTPVLSSEGYYRVTIVPDATGYTISATATINGPLDDCDDVENADRLQCNDLACREIYIYHGEKMSKNSDGDPVDANDSVCW